MAELNQNLMNTIEAPKGRVTVQAANIALY